MARADAVVNVVVSGSSKIDKLIGKLAQLESIVDAVSQQPLSINSRTAQASVDTFYAQVKSLEASAKGFDKTIDETTSSINKYSLQLDNIDKALTKLNPGTKKYEAVLARQKKLTSDLAESVLRLGNAEEKLKQIQDKSLPDAQQKEKEAIRIQKLSKALEQLADDYLKVGIAQERGARGGVLKSQSKQSIAQLNTQAQILGQVAANSKAGSEQFNKFTIASQTAGQAVYKAQQQQLKALAFGLSGQAPAVSVGIAGEKAIPGARAQVGELISSYSSIVKSEAAMGAFHAQAKQLQSLVPHLSDEFVALEEVLSRVDQDLAAIGRRGQFSAINPQKGPAARLDALQSVIQRANYEKRITDEVSKQDALAKRIERASLNEVQKKELRNQLELASTALGEKRIDDAQRLSRQIDRERFSMERANKVAAQVAKGGIYRTGLFSGVNAEKIRQNTVRSGEIVEQSLLNLKAKGVDVDKNLVTLQGALNDAKKEEYDRSIKNLGVLQDQVAEAAHYVNLQNKIAAGVRSASAGGKGGGRGAGGTDGTGLDQALQRLREARGARLSFFGDVSPAEAIDKIVREFNAGATQAGDAANNVTTTIATELKAGGAQASAAGKGLGDAVAEGLYDGLGIASPSKVAKDAILNVADTLVATAKSVKGKVRAAFDDLTAGATVSLAKPKTVTGLPFGPMARSAPRTPAVNPLANVSFGIDKNIVSRFSGKGPARKYDPGVRGIFTPPPMPPAGEFGSNYSILPSPYPSFNMDVSRFPIDHRLVVGQKRNKGKDANLLVSEGISRYRSAIDNFWNGEDSSLSAITKVVTSATQLSIASNARKLQRIKTFVPKPAEPAAPLTIDQEFQRVRAEARSAISKQRKPLLPKINDLTGDLKIQAKGLREGADAFFKNIKNTVENIPVRDLANKVRSGAANVISGMFGGGGGRPPSGTRLAAAGGPPERDPADLANRISQARQQGAQALLGLEELRQPNRATINELNALSAVLVEARSNLDPLSAGFNRLDAEIRDTIANLGRMQERRDPGADFLTRRFGPRGGRAISEGLIGGAFPLLFGQGVGASVGGGLGGALGGFAGGGLGFGLSLIGTALGTAFDTASESAKELGAAMRKPVESFSKLSEKLFFSSRATEEQIQKIIEYGNTSLASAMIQEEAIKKFGANGVKSLAYFESESDKLNRAWAETGMAIQALLAGPLGALLESLRKPIDRTNQRSRAEKLMESLSSTQKTRFDAEVSKAIEAIIIPQIEKMSPAERLAAGINPNQDPRTIKNTRNPEASVNYLSALDPQALQSILDKFEPIAINAQIKIKPQSVEAQISDLQNKLEAIDIASGIIQQVRSAAREQQDIDKQRAEIVTSYEQNIGQIRESIEDEISRRRFSLLEAENEILNTQGSNRIKMLELENKKIIAAAGIGQPEEVANIAKKTAEIVGKFTEGQLTAAEEQAKILRDSKIEEKQFDFEAGKFKAGIAKEVARLNLETAKQVQTINEQVARRNEDTDTRRFEIEKKIAELQFHQLNYRAKSDLDQMKLLKSQNPSSGITQKDLEEQAKYVMLLGRQMEAVRSQVAPPRIRGIAGIGGLSVSTSGVDKIMADQKAAIDQLLKEKLTGLDLTQQTNIQEFQAGMQDVRSEIEKFFDEDRIGFEKAAQQKMQISKFLRMGYSQELAQKAARIEQEKELLELSYQNSILILEQSKAKKTSEEIAVIDAEIAKLKTRLGLSREIANAAISRAAQQESPFAEIETQRDLIQEQLNAILKTSNLVISAAGAIGDAFSQSFRGIIDGTMTADQALASFFNSVANHFLDMATQIIAKWIEMAILNTVLQLFPGAPSAPIHPGYGGGFMPPPNANGNAFNANGIVPFANGGMFTNSIVSSPTLFKFADGAAMRTGVMGEAGSEAIMPLSRGPGGALGVHAYGGGGGDTNITIHVDATGTKVAGDDSNAKELGRVVTAAVQSEIIKQKRPGGLLSS